MKVLFVFLLIKVLREIPLDFIPLNSGYLSNALYDVRFYVTSELVT